jgi:DNA-binding response OmpR family regulator
MTRILVIEDDASIREITELALQSAGHDALVVSNGPAALELLAREAVDVILLDVRMPLMDGAEFARRYRETAAAPVPIIVLTAARDATIAANDLPAARYIEKPFDLEHLLTAIGEVAETA